MEAIFNSLSYFLWVALALTLTAKSPLTDGVPTIWPLPLTDRPAGRPVAP